jgi:hypothetical protein
MKFKPMLFAVLLLPILAMASAGAVFKIIANDGKSDKTVTVANKAEVEDAKKATKDSPTIDSAVTTIQNKAIEKGYSPGTVAVTKNAKDGSATVVNSATGTSYKLVPAVRPIPPFVSSAPVLETGAVPKIK